MPLRALHGRYARSRTVWGPLAAWNWAIGWNKWIKYGEGTNHRTTEIAHTGEASVCFDGMKGGGPHQTLQFEPGAYAITAFVYLPEGQETMGTVAVQSPPWPAMNR